MGRGGALALGLLMSSRLWGTCGAQRPRWYYVGLEEPPFGMAPDCSPPPLHFPFSTQTLLWCSYWIAVGTLAVTAVLSAVFFVKQLVNALRQKQGNREPPQQGDSEEAALMEALHLLDAMMEKTWRHLRRMERRRAGRREAKAAR